ncbi:MAG: hypothetical protein HQK60_03735 [Deltaproteobacteria bacterium]|nr:hypothetical protein [Deltaproteobacteria bacterium]
MTTKEFAFQTTTGEYDLEAHVRLIGRDCLVAIWGGDKPHIGAVAVAHPRPSLKDSTKISASSSVICFLGHKEDDLAKSAAEILAAAFNTSVVVTAGIHWDNLDEAGIKKSISHSRMLVEMIRDGVQAFIP